MDASITGVYKDAVLDGVDRIPGFASAEVREHMSGAHHARADETYRHHREAGVI